MGRRPGGSRPGRLAPGRLGASGVARPRREPLVYVEGSILGHYDLWLIGGSLLVVLAPSAWGAGAGILLACVGHPQQALVASVALLGTSVLLPGRPRLKRAVAFAACAMVAVVAAEAWLAVLNVRSKTGSLDPQGILFGLRLFLGSWPITVYSFLGPLWLLLVVALVTVPRRLRWAVLPALLVPLAATLITLDMTRIFVATATAALTLFLREVWVRHWRDEGPPAGSLAVIAVLALLLPAVVVYPEPAGYVRLPYDDILTFLRWTIDWALRR